MLGDRDLAPAVGRRPGIPVGHTVNGGAISAAAIFANSSSSLSVASCSGGGATRNCWPELMTHVFQFAAFGSFATASPVSFSAMRPARLIQMQVRMALLLPSTKALTKCVSPNTPGPYDRQSGSAHAQAHTIGPCRAMRFRRLQPESVRFSARGILSNQVLDCRLKPPIHWWRSELT